MTLVTPGPPIAHGRDVDAADTVAAGVTAAPEVPGARLARRLLLVDLLVLAAVWAPFAATAPGRGAGRVLAAIGAAATGLALQRQLGLYRPVACALPISEVARSVAAGLAGAEAYRLIADMAGRPQGVLPLECGVLAGLAIAGDRWLFARWLREARSAGRYLRRTVLVGTNDDAAALWRTLANEPELGYHVTAVAGPRVTGHPWDGLPGCTTVSGLVALARGTAATGVLVVGSAIGDDDRRTAVRSALDAGLHVQVWPGLGGLASWRVRVAPVSALPVLQVEPHRVSSWQLAAKRVLDVAVAVLALLAALPVLAVAAALIKLEDHGPVLYRSERVGRGGETITVWKLRTMAQDAEARRAEVAALNERTDGPLFKATRDPRVTRIGGLLRATSIDEIPQLWQVVTGRMSLVGPRPALPAEVAAFDADLLRRHDVRPGITGLWQIEARDNPSFEAYRRLDLTYVDNWTLRLDLVVLAGTAHLVLVRLLDVVRRRQQRHLA